MDLKDLTNYQLVLLTLLVSFVTSIATGITTVYLLQQSPTVSSVINQVIQRTVEKVSDETPPPAASGNQVVMVKESDIVPVVVENAKKSTVTISYECNLTEADKLAGQTCLKNSFGFITSEAGQFFTTTPNEQGVSKALIYPGTGENNSLSYTRSLRAPNGFTYNSLDLTKEIKVTMPHVLAFAKVLPSEGETLVLYDPQTSTTKKLYVEKVDTAKKKFTVDRALTDYVGLPILNLDGAVAGVVAMNGETTSIVSAQEIAEMAFTKVVLTTE